MALLPIVIVEWTDAFGEGTLQWWEGQDIEHAPLIVKSVGYLMREDDVGVTIWQDMCKEDGSSYRGKTFIPRGMIKDIIPLYPKKVRKRKNPQPSE